MADWSAEVQATTLTLAVAATPVAQADGDVVQLKPGESCQVTVTRIDNLPTPVDQWSINIQGSSNKDRAGDPAWPDVFGRTLYMKEDELTMTFVVSGWFQFRLRLANASVSPTELVSVEIFTKKDSVNFGA